MEKADYPVNEKNHKITWFLAIFFFYIKGLGTVTLIILFRYRRSGHSMITVKISGNIKISAIGYFVQYRFKKNIKQISSIE